MTQLVFCLLVFLVVGTVFLFIHLMIGKFVRPYKPESEKLTIYECGEPTVGSAWIQFDLRYYLVALLFVIFDVEVAFFFPWAVVFGKSNEVARTLENGAAMKTELAKAYDHQLRFAPNQVIRDKYLAEKETLKSLDADKADDKEKLASKYYQEILGPRLPGASVEASPTPRLAKSWAALALVDIFVFFSVLMVGFAYLWKRGDIDWVRHVPTDTVAAPELPVRPEKVAV
jgi:NADH-quinone oxidoreductase subunit A